MKLAALSSLFAATACFAQSGALDLSFNAGAGSGGSWISSMCLTTNGQIVVAGNFLAFNGTPRQYLARLNSDGSLDQTFDPGTGPNNPVSSVSVGANGKVLIAGAFSQVDGLYQPYVARLREDGSLDLTFTNVVNGAVNDVVSLNNGGCLIAGSFSTINGAAMNNIARFNADGSLDTSFSPAVVAPAGVQTLAVQSNGYIVIGGNFSSVGGLPYQYAARLTSTGSVDTSFVGPGSFGPLTSSHAITAINIETNGQLVILGYFATIDGYSELGVARLNSDGTLDATFRNALISAWGNSVGVQVDGKIVILASPGVSRLNPDGSVDSSFGTTVSFSYVDALALQADGKILVAGSSFGLNGTNINGIARLLGNSAVQAGVQLLNMNLYPGMFLSGSVGTNYRVEYTTNLTSPSLWTPLTNLTLTNSPTFVPDPTLPQGYRFYRAVTIP
jgi:uncharacterized delta-60 repeat protein